MTHMIEILAVASDDRLRTRVERGIATYAANREGDNDASVLVALYTAKAAQDKAFETRILQALDKGEPIILVAFDSTPPLKWIDHLIPVSFRDGDDFAALGNALDAALDPNAPRPMRVQTPAIRRSNQRWGIAFGLAAVGMFLVGIILVGRDGLQAPQDEYDLLDTQVAQTQAYFIDTELNVYSQFLPRSTQDAAEYASTLRAVPTRFRPFMGATATAVGQGTPLVLPTLSAPVVGEAGS